MGRGLLLLLVAAVLAAGCGQEPSATPAEEGSEHSGDGRGVREPQDEPAEAEPAVPAPGAEEDSAAPLADGLDFTLPAVGGGQVVGAELAGRDVALWFWAPW